MDADNGFGVPCFIAVLSATLGGTCIILMFAACCVTTGAPRPTPVAISADTILAAGYADAIRTDAESRRDVRRIEASSQASVVGYDQLRQTLWAMFGQVMTVVVTVFGFGCAWRVRRWNR